MYFSDTTKQPEILQTIKGDSGILIVRRWLEFVIVGGQYYHRVDTDEMYAEFLIAKENSCKFLQRERVRTHRQKKAQEPKGTTMMNKQKKEAEGSRP